MSPPIRGRGLKPIDSQKNNGGSPPIRGRGLKLPECARKIGLKKVAPYTGAWIETPVIGASFARLSHVAPYTGAWIETKNSVVRPLRGRGLKLLATIAFSLSPPIRGRGLKREKLESQWERREVAPYYGGWIYNRWQ